MRPILLLAALALSACSRPHVATLLDFCTALQRQSEADVKKYHEGTMTEEDRARHDAGFELYKSKCIGPDGKGIAPSAPTTDGPLPGSDPNLTYHM